MDNLLVLFRVNSAAKRMVNQAMLSALGITFSQGNALLHLSQSSELSCQELARQIGCGASRISRVIRELEKLRLIQERRDSEDRRVLQLSLTPDGAALAYLVPAVIRNAEIKMFSFLPEENRLRLIELLSRMASNMNAFSE